WQDILLEEVFEAFAESDTSKLRTELIQVAAVAQQWVEAIDRRTPEAS
ncbi:NUDIX hydrolase, partial [Subtercola vilae]